MPELPEVETIVLALRAGLGRARIMDAIVHRSDIIRSGTSDLPGRLIGRRIVSVEREGKRIKLMLTPDGQCIFHLGMSGRLTLERPQEELLSHTHLQIRFVNRSKELRFRDPRRFGGVWFFDGDQGGDQSGDPSGIASGASSAGLASLGPDALTIRAPVLRGICRRGRGIKALLLDQQVVSGLGNIYTDESLFDARIHPLRRASELADGQVGRLAGSIRKILRRSIDSGGATLRDYRKADGSEGAFQRICRVYGREGQACLRCGSPVRRILVAGRSTHVCAVCQPLEA